MFNTLANYLLGYTTEEPTSGQTGSDVRLTAVIADDDWVLVDRPGLSDTDNDTDTDGSSDRGSCGSMESLPEATNHPQTRRRNVNVRQHLLPRTPSTSSLPCANVEESWYLTPPPCFTSAGPVHMETSPLENLLIEHPSMSVYQHTSGTALVAIAIAAVTSPTPSLRGDDIEEVEEEEEDIAIAIGDGQRLRVAIAERLEDRRAVVPRRGTVDTLQQQERQCLKIKNAQKLQIHKACQSLKRGYIERNNKAREVNCRNHRQRRGERSQGSARSNANNNRKCC